MELETAKRLWQEDHARLDFVVHEALIQRPRLAKANTSLKHLSQILAFELLINATFVAIVGAFIAANYGQPRYVIPALFFDAYAIASLIGIAQQAVQLARIDVGGCVVDMQRKLGSLRVLRIRTAQWIVFLGPLMWLPLLIIGLRLFSVDAYATLGTGYLVATAAVGLVTLPVGIFVARRYGDRIGNTAMVKAVVDTLCGHSLREAMDTLAGIERFRG